MTPAEDPGKDKGKPTLGPPSSPGPANKSADKQPETMQCPSYTYIWNSGAPGGVGATESHPPKPSHVPEIEIYK